MFLQVQMTKKSHEVLQLLARRAKRLERQLQEVQRRLWTLGLSGLIGYLAVQFNDKKYQVNSMWQK